MVSRSAPAPDMAPAGWGDPARRHGLPPHAARWLDREVGHGRPSSPVTPVVLPPSGLPADARAALVDAVGADHVLVDDGARLLRAAGRSYLDLVRLRSGRPGAAPDAVVLPADADEVAAVLRACSETASPSSPSAGAPAWSAGSLPCAAGTPPSSRSTCGGSTGWCRSTGSRSRRCSSPACAGRPPRRCWPSTG
jgi:alkyldihydroxyacetonephosphate synthase